MAEERELHEMGETGRRWVEHGMQKSEQSPVAGSPPYRTKAGTDVEQRRRVIVALLHQHQDGLTAREIREATGASRPLTDSALSGPFTRGVVHKCGHRSVLTAPQEAMAAPRSSGPCSISWVRTHEQSSARLLDRGREAHAKGHQHTLASLHDARAGSTRGLSSWLSSAAGKPRTGMVASVPYRSTVCLWPAISLASPAGAAPVCTIAWKAFPARNAGTALAGIWTVQTG